MSGRKISTASKTILDLLERLPPHVHFNIVGFGSTYKKLFPSAVSAAQPEYIERARQACLTAAADLGGTGMCQYELALCECKSLCECECACGRWLRAQFILGVFIHCLFDVEESCLVGRLLSKNVIEGSWASVCSQ